MPVVGKATYFTSKWSGRIEESFKFNTGNHVRMFTITVLGKGLFRNAAKTRGHDYSTDFQGHFFRLLAEINGFALANRYADLAGIMGKMQTAARINIVCCRDSLGIIDVNRTGYVQAFIVVIFLVPWTISGAEPTGRAVICIDIARTLYNISFETTRFSLQGNQISISKNFDIWRPTGLNQLGRQDSERTVVGRESLVQLSHYTADGRRFLNQVDVVPQIGQVESCLDPGDTAAQDHNCPFPALFSFSHNFLQLL